MPILVANMAVAWFVSFDRQSSDKLYFKASHQECLLPGLCIHLFKDGITVEICMAKFQGYRNFHCALNPTKTTVTFPYCDISTLFAPMTNCVHLHGQNQVPDQHKHYLACHVSHEWVATTISTQFLILALVRCCLLLLLVVVLFVLFSITSLSPFWSISSHIII